LDFLLLVPTEMFPLEDFVVAVFMIAPLMEN
jgi:hypothetical protein